jgi:hypothetical protein
MITILLLIAAIYFGAVFSDRVVHVYNYLKELWKK